MKPRNPERFPSQRDGSAGMLSALRQTIRTIPRGKVASYGQVAEAAGFSGAARQVAWALHNCGDRLPWHRVVGAGGRILLGGHHGLEQRLRLEGEGVRFRGDCIRMDLFQFQFPKPPALRKRNRGTERRSSRSK